MKQVITTVDGIEFEIGFNGLHHYLLRNGEDYAGLWFEGKRLADYDGVFGLTRHDIKAIRNAGFVVPRDFE
jgi:hypothetical protein